MKALTKLVVFGAVCLVGIQAVRQRRTKRSNYLDLFLEELLAYEKRQEQDIRATCVLQPNTNSGFTDTQTLSGVIHFIQPPGENTRVTGEVFGFDTAGSLHGFHVHELGDESHDCDAFGGHYNPNGVNHGARENDASARHVGDMGNIEACMNPEPSGNYKAPVEFPDHIIQLSGEQSVLGRSVVVHAGEDDLGLGGESDSLTTGHAGARLACCVITEQSAPEKEVNQPKKCPKGAPPSKRDKLLQNLLDILQGP